MKLVSLDPRNAIPRAELPIGSYHRGMARSAKPVEPGSTPGGPTASVRMTLAHGAIRKLLANLVTDRVLLLIQGPLLRLGDVTTVLAGH